MKKHSFSITLVIVLAALLWNPYFSQKSQENTAIPSTLDKYDLVARGKMSQARGNRPVQIARLDNNGEILIACLKPKTSDELKLHGVNFLQSQLELLVDWELLNYDRKHHSYRTTIHVYGVDKASAIRQQVDTAVRLLADSLNDEIVSLKGYLEQIDREKSLFAILYAYILHSYSMQQFGDEIYRKPQLSDEHPFWNGYAWAIYPIRKFNTGVTAMPVEGSQLYVVSAEGVPGLNFKQITAFVKDIAPDCRVEDPELKKSLTAFDLFDGKGNLIIPIFEQDWSSRLGTMAKKVYAQTTKLADSNEMKNILGMATQAQASMFLHYEIRYAFLIHLLKEGTVPAPFDFENASNNSPSDMKNLIFLMKSEGQKDFSSS